VGKTYVEQARFVVENDPLAAAWDMVETKRGPKANGGKVSPIPMASDATASARCSASTESMSNRRASCSRTTRPPPPRRGTWAATAPSKEAARRPRAKSKTEKFGFVYTGHSVLTAIADTAAREAVAVGECVQEFLNASPELAALMKADEAAPAPTSN
jgi:hypothetical protein